MVAGPGVTVTDPGLPVEGRVPGGSDARDRGMDARGWCIFVMIFEISKSQQMIICLLVDVSLIFSCV
jgi:hypothetical protein